MADASRRLGGATSEVRIECELRTRGVGLHATALKYEEMFGSGFPEAPCRVDKELSRSSDIARQAANAKLGDDEGAEALRDKILDKSDLYFRMDNNWIIEEAFTRACIGEYGVRVASRSAASQPCRS